MRGWLDIGDKQVKVTKCCTKTVNSWLHNDGTTRKVAFYRVLVWTWWLRASNAEMVTFSVKNASKGGGWETRSREETTCLNDFLVAFFLDVRQRTFREMMQSLRESGGGGFDSDSRKLPGLPRVRSVYKGLGYWLGRGRTAMNDKPARKNAASGFVSVRVWTASLCLSTIC